MRWPLGVLGAYLVARRRKIRFPALLDAVAPGIVVAQAIGRLGIGSTRSCSAGPTTLPWGLEIDVEYRPAGFEEFATFHPTFLYELLWNLGVAAVLVWADRRFRLGHGKVFALYVLLYTAGRFWIEALRIDTVNEIGGFRLNNYTSLIVFLAALIWLLWLIKYRPGPGDRRRRRRAAREPRRAWPSKALTTWKTLSPSTSHPVRSLSLSKGHPARALRNELVRSTGPGHRWPAEAWVRDRPRAWPSWCPVLINGRNAERLAESGHPTRRPRA